MYHMAESELRFCVTAFDHSPRRAHEMAGAIDEALQRCGRLLSLGGEPRRAAGA